MHEICITAVCLLYYRNANETREPGFWTDNVNEGLVKAYKDSAQVYSSCAIRGNPVVY